MPTRYEVCQQGMSYSGSSLVHKCKALGRSPCLATYEGLQCIISANPINLAQFTDENYAISASARTADLAFLDTLGSFHVYLPRGSLVLGSIFSGIVHNTM